MLSESSRSLVLLMNHMVKNVEDEYCASWHSLSFAITEKIMNNT